ncbi:MAG: metallophosphoesterase [Candidatus Pristimantibacillus sp.]
MQFDLISDIHLDFWVEYSRNHLKVNKRLDEFIRNIVPEKPSRTLVIAGDLGHYNKQNYMLLNKLKAHYKYILIVAGNHDYYLITKSIRNKYRYNSVDRLNEMKQMVNSLPDVVYLDGNVVQIDGIAFGGAGMWYDFEYGAQKLHKSKDEIYEHWQSYSNDSVLIAGTPRLTESMFQSEADKLSRIVEASDVIVTHISPDWAAIPEDRLNHLANSYYYFDGASYFPQIKDKIWCYGHVHRREDYINHQCRFINASLGYPDENESLPKKIMMVRG